MSLICDLWSVVHQFKILIPKDIFGLRKCLLFLNYLQKCHNVLIMFYVYVPKNIVLYVLRIILEKKAKTKKKKSCFHIFLTQNLKWRKQNEKWNKVIFFNLILKRNNEDRKYFHKLNRSKLSSLINHVTLKHWGWRNIVRLIALKLCIFNYINQHNYTDITFWNKTQRSWHQA